MTKYLFDVRHKETGKFVSVFAVSPLVVGGEAYGADFLVWSENGWDFVSCKEFEPLYAIYNY